MSVNQSKSKRSTQSKTSKPKRSAASKARLSALRNQKHCQAFAKLACMLFVWESIFTEMEVHGNARWKPFDLSIQALVWSWVDTENVTDGFEQCLEVCESLGLDSYCKCYSTFMDALVKHNEAFTKLLGRHHQTLIQESCKDFLREGDYFPLAFDGSRLTAPRSQDNEQAFCAPNYGNGVRAKYGSKLTKGMRRKRNEENPASDPEPQVWITMMWQMSTRIAFKWQLGPSNSSEREHAQEMLKDTELPENTLFCADAGFIGYPIWSEIINAGHDFLVRVGGNVKLLTEQVDVNGDCPVEGIVLCWPKDRMKSGDPPLRLRLVKVKIGKTTMWMLTSITNPRKLTKKQIVKLYRMRWGIEVEFRGLKQTMDKRKLRCRNSARLLVELDWSIRAMAVAELWATVLQIKFHSRRCHDRPCTTKHRSLAKTLRAIRKCMRHLANTPDSGEDLATMLANAKVQQSKNNSNKRARYRPKPKKKPLSPPQLISMDQEQREKLEILRLNIAT